MKIWDISPTISAATAVFPGDVAFSRSVSLDFQKGHNLVLSAVNTTLHIGAHADASNHYHRQGKGIEARDLSAYLGLAQVIQVNIPRGERIKPEHVREEIKAPRVLFRTDSFPDPDHWNSDFNSLSPELIEKLAFHNVRLAGIDTPSVDPETSKALESHNAIYKHDLAILEGLILNQVEPGFYGLVALPLKLKDADASPVRAILIPKEFL